MRSNHIHGHVGCQTIRLRAIAQTRLVPEALLTDLLRSTPPDTMEHAAARALMIVRKRRFHLS